MKKLLYISLIAGGIYLATKVRSNTGAFANLETRLKRITRVRIANGVIELKIDLNITNLSKFNLGFDTFNVLSIRQLKFFNAHNRALVGKADVYLSELKLPSKETIVLSDIICRIPVSNLLKNLSLFSNTSNLKVVPVFNMAGKEFEINPENFV